MNYAPIALFVYNRLSHLQRTIESLRQNTLSKQSDLFIFSDGPKSTELIEKVESIRRFCYSIEGFNSITVFPSQKNNGLAKSIIKGVTQIVNDFGTVIVIEDDMIFSKYFLQYMNDNLRLYENDDRVISVHGYSYPVTVELPEYFFLKGADCWGWGTWKRGWDLFESDGKKLLEEITRKGLIKRFNYNNSFNYIKMLKNQIHGKNDSWAIRWYASAFLKNKLTLYPGKSLVENIGLDNTGTNCTSASDIMKTYISERQISCKNIPVVENEIAFNAIHDFYKKSTDNFLLMKIIKILLNRLHRFFNEKK